MADKETGLNIPVSAVADKDSAKEAVNELTKGVLSSLKDGYIEIPAELKVPIKGASKDLEKAQKDVINQWEKTFKEGFSSSAKDLDNLTAAYQRFKKLAGQQHKANTKQSRGISAIMGEPIQAYSMSKREAQARGKEIRKELEKAQKRSTKQNITSEEKKLLKEEIDNAIKQENKRRGYDKLSKELRRGTSRARGSTPGADINLGIRSPVMGGPYLSKDSLLKSEISPYGNIDESRRAKELAEIREKERESLKTKIDKDYKIGGKDNKIGLRGSDRSQSGTEYELIKKALLTELAKIQGGLIKGRPDATSQKLIDQVFANLAYDEEQGIDPLKSVMGIHNMLQKRYDTKGKIGTTDGTIKGEGPNQKEVNETLKQIYKILGQFIDTRQTIADNVRSIRDNLTSRTSANRSLYEQELNRVTNSDQMQAMKDALSPTNGLLTRTLAQNVRESTREGVADNAAGRASRTANAIADDTLKAIDNDASTGFNTEATANELTSLVKEILNILKGIPSFSKTDSSKTYNDNLSLGQRFKILKNSTDLGYDQIQKILADESNKIKTANKSRQSQIKALPEARGGSINPPKPPEPPKPLQPEEPESYTRQVEKSRIYASPLRQGFWNRISNAFDDLIGTTKEYEKILKANADEQDTMAAERIRTYGLNNGRNPNDTGDIAGMRRILQLYRTNKASIESNPELAQRIQLTPGREIDTTEMTKALNNALSGRNMRNAQMGGSIPRQILGAFTGFIGMPSLEKSRAQAEGLNQILGNVNDALQSVLINIQTKETELVGMEASGQAKFNAEGYLTADSTSAAFKTLADLEEEKLVLDSIKADLLANDKIIEQTGGKFSKLVKNLSFTSPVLKENNGILRNINAGLNKSGKALKFQSRFAEILNYSFQLMSRHIGQILKNWLWMINPLNLIKKAFDDFASYDPKWQRTMNVIKNNFREIILPFMEKIAQFLVNIIGFLDIISMKIQEAFGYTPISLFDQENANDFKKTYEEIQNVTAGFDELHDIGTSSSENDPNNLLGEIYTPQLSQGWIDLANQIGDLFAGLITGDLGFGDVMKKILEIAWNGLQQLWNWFKNTEIGQWLINNWQNILATILAIFLGWKLLKIAGSALFNALFGKLTSGSIGGIFSKVGGWITKALNATSIGSGILQGLSNTLVNGGGLIKTLKYAFTYPNLITQMGGWGQMLGMALVQGLGVAIGVAGVMKGFDMNADNASYNLGLMEAGGNEEDKKSNFWGTALGGVSGAIAGGALIGGPIGAAVGALAGLLVTSLAPAFEEVAVSAKKANNEMQKIEYYEGQVQGAQTQVDELTEYMDVLNQTLDKQKEKVYEQGEQLGISTSRMNELTTAIANGTFSTSMLTGEEIKLTDSLLQLDAQQQKTTEASKKLTEAKKNLELQSINLAIAQDVEAGNFEMAAARIEYAEAAGLMTTEEATAKRIQLYKQTGEEERANLLQNLTPEQRKLMMQYNAATDDELKDLKEMYDDMEEHTRNALVDGVDQNTVNEFDRRMNSMDAVLKKHSGFWQTTLDVLKEIFTLGFADTWTFNGEDKYYKEAAEDVKAGNADKYSTDVLEELKRRGLISGYAVGTNYVPNDGLAYLHQGEAVIPKKYNQPYQPPNTMSQAYMDQMLTTMRSLDNTIQQGIDVRGEFKQRGTDLVATVKKVENRSGNQPLNNMVFAR